MKIWVTRHGQTELNAKKLMQGRSDIPLNEVGIAQAKAAREKIGDIRFDAVYASPLQRAVKTAAIIGNVDPADILIESRIIETDFGKYEQKPYGSLGPWMTLYWALPELLPAPGTVETTRQMRERSHGFLKELEEHYTGEENILVVCHGGIIRSIRGYLEDVPSGYVWRPRPENCEIRVYECRDGQHRLIQDIK